MTMRAAVVALAIGSAACSAAPEPAPAIAATPRSSVVVVNPTPPSSTVTVTGSPPVSTVSTGGGGATSAVEVRVRELLTELDATTTPEGTVVTLPEQVLFDFDQAVLRADAATSLADLAEVLAFYADRRVAIRGHTDSRGDDAYNQDLSQRRATAVRDHLVTEHAVDPSRLEPTGFGETQPIAPNTRPDGADDPEGRQRNRRVEIVVQGATPP